MNLARGMSLSIGAGQGGFRPGSLLTDATFGFWAEVAPSYLWQDTARTSPVTAAGQTVASWQLNTAAGPIYATSATGPVYQIDGNGRRHLAFNGSTSGLVTSSVTPGSAEVQAFVGLRKLSDAASGIAVELSIDAAGLDGSFALVAPASAGAVSYRLFSRGTVAASAGAGIFAAAPDSAVLTGIANIGGDIARLRRNGAEVETTVTDQGTGNYIAAPIYIGRRAGTSLPFNGNIYSMIVRFGPALSAVRIGQAETWCNARTGAY